MTRQHTVHATHLSRRPSSAGARDTTVAVAQRHHASHVWAGHGGAGLGSIAAARDGAVHAHAGGSDGVGLGRRVARHGIVAEAGEAVINIT